MIRMMIIVTCSAALGAAVWIVQGTLGSTPNTTASEAEVALKPTHAMSRRERMARVVAETSAATAEKTAKAVLARKQKVEETASR